MKSSLNILRYLSCSHYLSCILAYCIVVMFMWLYIYYYICFQVLMVCLVFGYFYCIFFQTIPSRRVAVEDLLFHEWAMKGYSRPVNWQSQIEVHVQCI